MPSIESFDEDLHAARNGYGAEPEAATRPLVAVLDTRWCETCFTDKHDECGGKGVVMQEAIEQPLKLAA